jgi:hypothetical protein
LWTSGIPDNSRRVNFKSFGACALAITFLLPATRADPPDPYGDVDAFYAYITGIAGLAGYDTTTLPAVPSATFKRSVAAYFWGFPLETTFRTQISYLNGHGLPLNTLYAPGVIDTSTTVEAPDVNVLYTSGFLDLSGTAAFVLEVPDTTATNTYNIMEIVNAYGETTSSVGTRNFETSAVDNSGGNYLLVGPDYDTTQPLPAGVISYIQSATAQCWLIGRVAVDNLATATLPNGDPTPYSLAAGGAGDPLSLDNSVPLSQAYGLTALADYLLGQTTPAIVSSTPTPQQEIIAGENATTKTDQEFFQYVGDSAAQNGVPSDSANDQFAMYANFSSIGLTLAGYTAPSAPEVAEMNQAATVAASMLETMGLNTSALPGGGATATGWTVNTSLGEYAATFEGWLTNALTASLGTVANLAVDGTYPQTTIDSAGQPLNGANAYTITFPAGQLPPVQGFWSVTVYDINGFVVPNTGNTYYGDNVYTLGGMQLANILGANLDTTTVTFYLQNQPPSDPSLMPYWLPVPTGPFELLLRMYFPNSSDPSILNGTYIIPPVVRAAAPPLTHGVTMTATKRKGRAVFAITNTGGGAATFALRQTREVTNAYNGPTSSKPAAPAFTLMTKAGREDITRALARNKASVTLSLGETVKVVTQAKTSRPLAFKRTIRVALTATDSSRPATQASGRAKIVLPATAP